MGSTTTIGNTVQNIKECVDFAEAGGVAIGAAQNCHLPTQKSSSQENSTVPATDGMKNWRMTRLGTISRFMLLLLTARTDKCRERQLEPKDLLMQQSLKQER
jgi:hypothetical protein